MSESQSISHLLVIKDQEGKRTVVLESATCSIGRDPSNSIVLNSPRISRHHATLLRLTKPESTDYVFRLIDGDLQGKRSSNGLFLNGRRCFSDTLQPGDEIDFGGDVKAKYCTTASQSDVQYLTSEEAQDVSGFLANLNSSKTLVSDNQNSVPEASLERLASFPELVTNPIVEVDLARNITYLNPAAEEAFPDIRSHPQHPILAGLVLMTHNGETAHFAREVEVANRVFEQTIHHIIPSGLVRSYIVDITQRKRVEEALQQTTMLQRAILNSANYIIISTRLDGTVLTFNAAAERCLQYTSAEIVGKTTPIIFHDEQEIALRAQELSQVLDTFIPCSFEALSAIARRGQIDEHEWTFIRKDGSRFPVLLSMTALYDAEGKISGFLGIANDIAKRKRAEALLKQAHDDLEIKVRERTAELAKINLSLKAEITQRERTARELLLLQTIAQAITEAPNFEAAIAVTLTKVCETIGWNFAEAWIPDPQEKLLKLSPAWCSPNQYDDKDTSKLLHFRKASEQYSFANNVGIPGRVWATKQPEWDQDVSMQSEDIFLRAKIAQEAGLKAALGVPIIANEEVIAVGVFFSFNASQEDKRLIKLVKSVANQLGLFIERKRAEDALRSSMATNRALLNAIPDSLFRISREGIVVNFKTSKEQEMPMASQEFLGKSLYEVFPEAVACSLSNCVKKAFATGKTQILECQLPVNDEIWDYEVRIAVSAKNEAMAIFRDITERKQIEENIRDALEKEKQLGELKTRFISMASHEFRTPLATILSSSELLENYSHKWNEEKKQKHFRRIQTAIKHMTGLLEDVLLIGKAEAGKLEFRPTPFDLKLFCEEVIEEIQLTTSTHQIVACLPDQGSTACLDRKLLRHILTNLLSNAIKYSPKADRVQFDLICEADRAVIRIQDFGIGIPPEDQARLFDSFHRATNVGTISGTGLGLAILKKAVDYHGGEIAMESQVGIGTTFTVTLPYAVVDSNTDP